MWLKSRFRGDDQQWVMRMQRALWPQRSGELLAELRRAYARAERLLEVSTELGDRLYGGVVTWTPLRDWYAALAAEFRYVNAVALIQPEIPRLLDHLTHPERIARMWNQFLAREVEGLLREHPDVVRRLLQATFLKDEEGSAAEVWLRLYGATRFKHLVGDDGEIPV